MDLDSPRAAVVARVALVAVLAVVIFAAVRSGAADAILPVKCTVGLAGAAVSVTYDGVGAQDWCDDLAGQITNGGSWYHYSGDEHPGGAVICQVPLRNVSATVRDSGLLTAYGRGVCDWLWEHD